MIIFKAPLVAVAKARPRLSRRGVYTPPKTRQFESELALLARRSYRGPLLCEPLAVAVRVTLLRPKSSKRLVPDVKPDGDNFFKGVTDPLNGILWDDDARIVFGVTHKVYGKAPLIEVWAAPIAESERVIEAVVG